MHEDFFDEFTMINELHCRIDGIVILRSEKTNQSFADLFMPFRVLELADDCINGFVTSMGDEFLEGGEEFESKVEGILLVFYMGV